MFVYGSGIFLCPLFGRLRDFVRNGGGGGEGKKN